MTIEERNQLNKEIVDKLQRLGITTQEDVKEIIDAALTSRDLFLIGQQDISNMFTQHDFKTMHALEKKYADPSLFICVYGYICGVRAERARRQGRKHKD